jgi:hypothetical protein
VTPSPAAWSIVHEFRLYDESIPHPLFKHRNAACRRLLTFLNDFGMTPVARLRAGMPITPPPVEDDPAARFLGY